jgi:hypothetical protein
MIYSGAVWAIALVLNLLTHARSIASGFDILAAFLVGVLAEKITPKDERK